MEQIYQSAILQALGWALADSIWQMALLWLVYQLCIGLPVRNNPSVRHLGATIALFAGGLWFIGNVIYKLVHTSSNFSLCQGKFLSFLFYRQSHRGTSGKWQAVLP